MKLAEAEAPIRAALERLAESPRELRCFVVVREPLTKRFVQFCAPPPPSPFAGSARTKCPADRPLIFDGYGNGKPEGYIHIGQCCDVEAAVSSAIGNLTSFLPPTAELRIVEESTQIEQPS